MKRHRMFIGALIIAVLATFSMNSQADQASENILTFAGSGSVAHALQELGNQFATQFPHTSVVVSGGRTETGFEKLFNREVDAAMSARRISDSEKAAAAAKGMKIIEHHIGWADIPIITSPENTVTQLSVDQVVGILTGKITNWSAVGGPDRAIVLITPEVPGSGTLTYMKQNILGGAPFAQNATAISSYRGLVIKVANTEGAMGFSRMIDLAYLDRRGKDDRVNVLAVKAGEADAPQTPSPGYHAHRQDTVAGLHADYPLDYPHYLYVDAKVQDQYVREFINFCLQRSRTGERMAFRTAPGQS